VPRPEMLAAADQLGVPKRNLTEPSHLLEVAKALSADYVTLSEVVNYDGKYLANIRIAGVPSGEVIAVASERISSLDELAVSIEKSARRLSEKIKPNRDD